jgi:hypothetical protein
LTNTIFVTDVDFLNFYLNGSLLNLDWFGLLDIAMAVVGSQFTDGKLLSLVLICAILYGFSLLIYRLFFSPLSRIPGPWLTRISSIPEANALKQNRRAQWITDLFEQDPNVIAIRTGLNSVSFNHPDAVKEIYGMMTLVHLRNTRLMTYSRPWQNLRWVW